MEMNADCIVVGSGCTGAMAAQTLVEAGMKVLMVDAGIFDPLYYDAVPDSDYIRLRRTDPGQERYFTGNDPDAFWKPTGSGAQLTPPRSFVTAGTDTYIPYRSSSFSAVESLAHGGLGNAWGTGCCVFSRQELERTGLEESLSDAYMEVAGRIGITTGTLDAERFTSAGTEGTLPPVETEAAMQKIEERYLRNRALLNGKGFYLGRPSLAVLTREFRGRKPLKYNDLEFYTDRGGFAWRPWITIDHLLKKDNFLLAQGWLALSFSETSEGAALNCISLDRRERRTFRAPRIILASGPLGTARLAMRSGVSAELPVLTNPYSYLVAIHKAALGKEQERFKTSFAQLSLFYDPDGTHSEVSMASLYTYRSLMHFRVVKDAPFGFRDSLKIMRYMLSSLVIAGVHHPAALDETNSLRLEPDENSITGDRLRIRYSRDADRNAAKGRMKEFRSALQKLGCVAVKEVKPLPGASIHYAGTLPFLHDGRGLLHQNGSLQGSDRIFVADGSGFRFLPAKGLTFTLMANAHRVAKGLT